MCSASGFPSDHAPVVTTLHHLPITPLPLYPTKRGKYAIPGKPLESELHTLNEMFQDMVHDSLPHAVEASTKFSVVTATLTAAATAHGPP